ncbi:hypothetical protein D3C75_320340 [compost metagenome]
MVIDIDTSPRDTQIGIYCYSLFPGEAETHQAHQERRVNHPLLNKTYFFLRLLRNPTQQLIAARKARITGTN